MSNRDFASKQLKQIQNRINLAAKKANRDPSDITLVGASKQQSSDLLQDFFESSLNNLGENYLQEALNKQQVLTQTAISWHFIGRLQSNKCKAVAQHFNWVHAVDRLKIAKALAKARSVHTDSLLLDKSLQLDKSHQQGESPQTNNSTPLNVLIQLNVDDEVSKGGASLTEAPELCNEAAQLDGIRLRGLMLIPKPSDDPIQQRRPFSIARETLENINQHYGLKLDTLSMGMSNDFEVAISEGATMIRVGSDLFGPRTR